MDNKFEKICKIYNGLNFEKISYLLDFGTESITETPLFDSEGNFNKELLTKEGFMHNIFANDYQMLDSYDNDKEKENLKNYFDSIYGNLFDAIANMDNNQEMSEEELKFLASIGTDNKNNIIDKNDFFDLGLIERNDFKYFEPNSMKNPLNEPITNIIASQKVEENEPVTKINEELKINGKIDEQVIQGNVGDCWLLAGINALNSNEKGKEIIRNAIIPNDDGTVTVKFKGVGKEITIMPDEIKEHDTDTNFQDNYSNGDNDALVLEISMKKLIEQNPDLLDGLNKGISGGETYNFWKALIPNHNITYIQDTFDNNSSKSKHSPIFKEKVQQIFQQAINNKNIVMGFSWPRHALAITKIKENEVTYLNSMNNKTTTMSWDEFFEKIDIENFTYVDLSSL